MDGTKDIDLRSLWFLDLLSLLEPIERFSDEVKKISALDYLNYTEKMEMIRETRSRLLREMEERFEAFSNQVEVRKKELQDIVNPSKPDITEQTRLLLMEMTAVVEKMTLRKELTKRWETESPEEILRSYEDSLEAQDDITVEMFEAYAGNILERKGNKPAVTAFRERAERAINERLTPVQFKAQQELKEVEQLGSSLRTIFMEIASSIKKLLLQGSLA
jgi:hypothetical protein